MTKVVKFVQKSEKQVMGELNRTAVGRSISRVIKPLLDVKDKGVAEISRFSKTKFGKAVITAVAIYFGGAALAGAMGGGAAAATGASGWAGAAQGLSGAWTGVAQAGSAIAAGEFSAAGSALSTGAAGGSAGGAVTAVATPAAATAAVPEAAAIGSSASTAPLASVGQVSTAPLITSTVPAISGVPVAQSSGMLSSFMNSKLAPSLIQAGAGMLSSVGQAKSMEAMQDRADESEQARLDRYNRNVGTRLWG